MDDEMDGMDYQYSQQPQESSPNHQTTAQFLGYQQQQPPPQLQQQSLPQPQQQQQQQERRSLCPALQEQGFFAGPQHYNPHVSQGVHDRQSAGRSHTGYPFDPVHHSSVAPLPWHSQTSQSPTYHPWSLNGQVGDQHASYAANSGQTLPLSLPYPSSANQDSIGGGASAIGAFPGGSSSSLSAQTQVQTQAQAQPSMSINTHQRHQSHGQPISPLPLPTYQQQRWSHGPRLGTGSTPSSMSSMSSGTSGEHNQQQNGQRISQQPNPQSISFYAEASPPPSNPNPAGTTSDVNQSSRNGYPMMQRARSGQTVLPPLPHPHAYAGNSGAAPNTARPPLTGAINSTSVSQEGRSTGSFRWQAQQTQQLIPPSLPSQSSLPLPRGRGRSSNELRLGEYIETAPASGGPRFTAPAMFASSEAPGPAPAPRMAARPTTFATRLPHDIVPRRPRDDASDFDSEEDDLSDPYADEERTVQAVAQEYLGGGASARTDRAEGMAESRIRLHQMIRGQFSNKRIASRGAIASLQSVDIATIPESERSCIICYNDFGVENPEGIAEDPLRLPKCKHIFGDHCIKKWLADSDTCPYCRDKLPSELQRADPQLVRDFLARTDVYRRADGSIAGDIQDQRVPHPLMPREADMSRHQTDMLSRYLTMSGRPHNSPPRASTGERRSPPSDAPEVERRRVYGRPRRIRPSSSFDPVPSQSQTQSQNPQHQTPTHHHHQTLGQGQTQTLGQGHSQGQGQGQLQGQDREQRVNNPQWLSPAYDPRWQLTSLLARQYSASSDQANQHTMNQASFRQSAQPLFDARQHHFQSQPQQQGQHQPGQHPPNNEFSQFPPVQYPSAGPFAAGLPFQHMVAGNVGGSSPSSGPPFWHPSMMGQDQMDIDGPNNYHPYPGPASSRAS